MNDTTGKVLRIVGIVFFGLTTVMNLLGGILADKAFRSLHEKVPAVRPRQVCVVFADDRLAEFCFYQRDIDVAECIFAVLPFAVEFFVLLGFGLGVFFIGELIKAD